MAQTNRYPVARASAMPDYRPPSRPVPANDNFLPRRAPVPANDNWRPPSRPLAPQKLPRPSVARLLPRMAGRLVPILGWALLAWELYELWRWLRQGQQPNFGSTGTCYPEPNNGKPHAYSWRSGVSCLPSQPHPLNFGPYDFVPPGGGGGQPILVRSAMLFGPAAWQPGNPTNFNEWRDIQWWWYPTPFNGVDPAIPSQIPTYIPAFEPDPDFHPWLEPFVPPFMPQPAPLVPVRKPPPLVRPEGSSRGNHIPVTFTPTPTTSARPGLAPKRVKEKKITGPKGSFIRKWGGRLLSEYSEAADVVEALHDALPDEFQAKSGATQYEKLQALYKNHEHLNMADAMQALIENHQEDRIWGRGFAKIQEMFDDYGIDVGSLRL